MVRPLPPPSHSQALRRYALKARTPWEARVVWWSYQRPMDSAKGPSRKFSADGCGGGWLPSNTHCRPRCSCLLFVFCFPSASTQSVCIPRKHRRTHTHDTHTHIYTPTTCVYCIHTYECECVVFCCMQRPGSPLLWAS